MSVDSAHKRYWETAEAVFGIPFLVSLILQFAVPVSLAQGTLWWALFALGVVPIIAGIALIVRARRELALHGQPTDPGRPTSQVIKTDVFSISRNPLYLGVAVLLLGGALAVNNLWALVTLLVSIILCTYVLIRPEERYLTAKFGDEYVGYRASVRRWLGRKQPRARRG